MWLLALFLSATFLSATQAEARVSLDLWCETRSAGFELLSDLSATDQTALLALLARFDALAEPFLPGERVNAPAPLKIIVFSDRNHFQRLTGKRKFAGFMQPSFETNRLLIGPISGSVTQTTLHEYAHYLLRSRLDVSLPLWFDEGLASLLSATEFEDDEAVVGPLPVVRMLDRIRYEVRGTTPQAVLSRTLAATAVDTWPQPRINAFYDFSWLLVHYLYFHDPAGPAGAPERLTGFLSAGEVSLTDYLELPLRALLAALERHLRSPPVARIVSPVPGPGDLSHRCLDEFERDHELARAILRQDPDQARALIKPHFESHARDVDLLVTRARLALSEENRDDAEILAAEAAGLAPENPNAKILSADLLTLDCLFRVDENCRGNWNQARKLYRSALRADPNRYDAVMGLGLGLLYTGRPGEAINYLRVAYGKAPWAAAVNYYLGESYRLTGDTQATGYLQNARNWADLPVWRILAEESLRLLAQASGASPSDGG